MDQGPRTAPVAAPAGGPRRASILAAAVVVGLALAVIKPWSLGSSGPGGPAGSPLPARVIPPGSPATALVSPSAPSGDPNAMACLADEAEQVVTDERSAEREVRSWIAVPMTDAAGPLDPRLAPLVVFSSHVVGLGVCAPSTIVSASPGAGPAGSAGSGATLIDVRSVSTIGGVATAVDLGPPQLLADVLNGRDPALLYGPPQLGRPASSSGAPQPTKRAPTAASPSTPPSDAAAWRPGSYAIAFRFSWDDRATLHWLRIDLITGAGDGT